MTTILAYRDAIYADSRAASEDGDHVCTRKIIRIGDCIVACAGDMRYSHQFAKQLQEQGWQAFYESPGVGEKEEFSALVLSTEYGLWEYDEHFAGFQVDGLYAAIGTGAQAALGALETMRRLPVVNIDPVLAIVIACELDINSGLPVQYMQLDEFKLHKEW